MSQHGRYTYSKPQWAKANDTTGYPKRGGVDSAGRFFDCKGDYFREGVDPRNHHGRFVPEVGTILWPSQGIYWQSESKAQIDMGGTVCYLNHRVNRFHAFALWFVFGWKVTNL